MLRKDHGAVKCDAVYSGEILHQQFSSWVKMRTTRVFCPPYSLCQNKQHHIPEDRKQVTFLHITHKIFGPKFPKSHVRPRKTLHCRPPKCRNLFFPICDQFEPHKSHRNGSLSTKQSE